MLAAGKHVERYGIGWAMLVTSHGEGKSSTIAPRATSHHLLQVDFWGVIPACGVGIEIQCVEDVPLWTLEGDADSQGEPWRRSEIAKKEVAVFRKKAKRKNNSPLGKKNYMRASVFAADWLFVYFRQSAILKSASKNFLA